MYKFFIKILYFICILNFVSISVVKFESPYNLFNYIKYIVLFIIKGEQNLCV